jgi:hypothetical protein
MGAVTYVIGPWFGITLSLLVVIGVDFALTGLRERRDEHHRDD